jgi:hypothetical protein
MYDGDESSSPQRADGIGAAVRGGFALWRSANLVPSLSAVPRQEPLRGPVLCNPMSAPPGSRGRSVAVCTVGSFGSEDRLDYSIIGRGMNIVSRLETIATPGEILVPCETHAHVADEFACEAQGRGRGERRDRIQTCSSVSRVLNDRKAQGRLGSFFASARTLSRIAAARRTRPLGVWSVVSESDERFVGRRCLRNLLTRAD